MNRDEIVRQCKQAIAKGRSVESYEFYESVIGILNEMPLIKKSFPLRCCESCIGIQPYVQTEDLIGDDHIVCRNLVIGCENEKQCQAIYGMLKTDVK